MSEKNEETFIFYRIGDDGEWEQHRTDEWPPYRTARKASQMISDVLDRTKDMSAADREVELDRVATLIEAM